MATLLDLGIIEGIKPILMFLFIFAIIYALLQGTKVLGESKVIHAVIAFVFGIVMVLAKKLSALVMTMVPWFVVIGIFAVLILIVLKTLGVPDGAIQEQAKGNGIVWTVIILMLVVLIGAMISVFGNGDDNSQPIGSGYGLDVDGNIVSLENEDVVVHDPSISDYREYDVDPETDYRTYERSRSTSSTGDGSRSTDGDNYGDSLGKTFNHPKVLGFVLMMIIALFAVVFLTGSPEAK